MLDRRALLASLTLCLAVLALQQLPLLGLAGTGADKLSWAGWWFTPVSSNIAVASVNIYPTLDEALNYEVTVQAGECYFKGVVFHTEYQVSSVKVEYKRPGDSSWSSLPASIEVSGSEVRALADSGVHLYVGDVIYAHVVITFSDGSTAEGYAVMKIAERPPTPYWLYRAEAYVGDEKVGEIPGILTGIPTKVSLGSTLVVKVYAENVGDPDCVGYIALYEDDARVTNLIKVTAPLGQYASEPAVIQYKLTNPGKHKYYIATYNGLGENPFISNAYIAYLEVVESEAPATATYANETNATALSNVTFVNGTELVYRVVPKEYQPYADELIRWVKENPLLALAAAAVVGYILGRH